MEITFIPEPSESVQPPSQTHEPSWLWQALGGLTRGVGALLVLLGTHKLDASTRVVRSGSIGQFLVRLGAQLDMVALRAIAPVAKQDE